MLFRHSREWVQRLWQLVEKCFEFDRPFGEMVVNESEFDDLSIIELYYTIALFDLKEHTYTAASTHLQKQS